MGRYRKARALELGEPRKVEIPDELREAVATLTSPLLSYDFGTMCYFAGTPPEGRKAIDKLVAARRTDLLQMALLGPNPEGRVYAAEALMKLDERELNLTGRTRAIIARVRALKIPISVCEGCLVSTKPAAQLLPE